MAYHWPPPGLRRAGHYLLEASWEASSWVDLAGMVVMALKLSSSVHGSGSESHSPRSMLSRPSTTSVILCFSS